MDTQHRDSPSHLFMVSICNLCSDGPANGLGSFLPVSFYFFFFLVQEGTDDSQGSGWMWSQWVKRDIKRTLLFIAMSCYISTWKRQLLFSPLLLSLVTDLARLWLRWVLPLNLQCCNNFLGLGRGRGRGPVSSVSLYNPFANHVHAGAYSGTKLLVL